MKTYKIREIFSTLQGEGYHAGRAAIFVRFSGCNLWSGREEDRASGKGACARWCDTDFRGGMEMEAKDIRDVVGALWQVDARRPFVVLTGGEPLLQVDRALLWELDSCEVAVETNGTVAPPASGIDHLTVSPKVGGEMLVRAGDELRVAHPQWSFEDLKAFEKLNFVHFFLSPVWPTQKQAFDSVVLAGKHARVAAEFCRTNPPWRLSLQMHKLAGFP